MRSQAILGAFVLFLSGRALTVPYLFPLCSSDLSLCIIATYVPLVLPRTESLPDWLARKVTLWTQETTNLLYKGSFTVYLTPCLTTYIEILYRFTGLVESKSVKQKVICIVILPLYKVSEYSLQSPIQTFEQLWFEV